MHMAAGRHRGLSDNAFKDNETDSDVSQRGFSHTKDYKNSRRYNDSGKSHNTRDRGRVGQKGIKMEYSDGDSLSSSRSYSGTSSDGYGKRKVSIKALDREPGELSSETDSDSYGSFEAQLRLKDCNTSKSESTPSNENKRKFSPIIWDMDDSGGRKAYKTSDLPPPVPHKMNHQSPIILRNGGVHVSSTENTIHMNYGDLPASMNMLPSLNTKHYTSLKSDVLPSPPRHQGHQLTDEHGETNEAENDSNVPPTRNISSSRWANEPDTVPNEDKILNQDDILTRRKSPYSKYNPKVKVSASGVPRVKASDVEMTKYRGSDTHVHCRSAHMDDSDEEYYRRNDGTETDEEDKDSDSKLDVDSGDEYCSGYEPLAPQRSVNMLCGCRSVDEFERMNKIDEGTYGVVYRAKDKKTGEIVALKKVKMEKEREGFPLTSLREINILLSFHHPSIVDVKEVVVGNTIDSIFMVMEYMEHDLKGLMEAMKQPFSQSEVKCLMIQLLEGVKYLHDNWVLHRDLKTSNLLLNNRGELKICDFGLSRQYGSPLKPYTHLVVTLWYRAPELLLGARQYSTTIDMWSLGCIMAELLSKQPLFNGKTEFDQLDKIFRTLGTPSEEIWPGFSKLPGVKVNFVKHKYNLLRKKFPATSFTGSHVLSDPGFDLLNKFLTYDPEKRITASDALNHDWFREVPLPKSKDFMPTFPAQHDQDRRTCRMMKSPDPLEEQRRKELQQGDLGSGGIFG